MNSKINIAIIEPIGGHGGMHYYNLGLAIGLSPLVGSVYLFSSNISFIPSNENLRVINSFNKVWLKKNKAIFIIRYVNSLLSSLVIAKKKKCKVLHLHQFHFDILLIINVLFSKLFFQKIVLTVHDIESFEKSQLRKLNYLERFVYSLVNKFIVHNQFSYNELTKKFNHDKIEIILHGNYIPFVKKVNKNSESTRLNLLFFGHLKKVKGLDILLEALGKLKNNYLQTNFTLTIVGKPWRNTFHEYSNYIENFDLRDNVTLDLYYVSDEKVFQYFNDANLIVLPYKKIYQSGVVLLAMSYGRAVLASDLDAFNDIIKDGQNGYLFRTEDADSLATKLNQIVGNLDDLTIIENRAYDFIKINYNWFTIGENTVNVYNSILN